MVPSEIHKLKDLLVSFLGESKRELDDSFQLQFPCPMCVETKGEGERRKFNLEVNLQKGVFQCWSCAQYNDDMHGSIVKLIKIFGNDSVLKEYKETVRSFKQSRLYNLYFKRGDFDIEANAVEKKEVELPPNFIQFEHFGFNSRKALYYLAHRGITWDIIERYKIGFTVYNEQHKQLSSRIVIPSYNKYGELNYWTGRDFTALKGRQKYYNPIVERKDIIFNEDMIDWDADITLVEGPFDHIVVPNSIPLLGKVLKTDFKLYQTLIKKANANINIFLDADAFEDIKKIYSLLNHDRLYNKIRYIPSDGDLDPSKIFELYGKKGISAFLSNSQQIDEVLLI